MIRRSTASVILDSDENVIPMNAPAGTATVAGHWEMAADMTDSVGSPPVDGSAEGTAAFGQPTIAAGGTGGVAFNGAGHGEIPAAAVFRQQAFGISIYTQISALADTVTRSQIVNRDAAQPPNGVAIEYLQVDGINRLDPYMRTDAGGSGSARRMARTGGIADLPLDTGLLVTFTYDPATTPKCKVYLRQAGDSSNRLVGNGLIDESEVTQGWTGNDSRLLVATYFGGVGRGRGAFQRLMFWAGAPSRAQLDALPEPQTVTVTLPNADGPVAADFSGRNIGVGQTTLTINPTESPSQNATTATVSIVGTTGPVTAQVGADGQTVTITKTGSRAYTVTYRLTTSAGQDDGVISGTIAATGVTPSFYTATTPGTLDNSGSGLWTYTGPLGTDVSSRSPDPPQYNRANPKAATFNPDPARWNTKMCRLTGYPGMQIFFDGVTAVVDTNGNPMNYTATHGHDTYSSQGLSTFNADASLIMLGVPDTHGGIPTHMLDGSTFKVLRVKGSALRPISFNVGNGCFHPTIRDRWIEIALSGSTVIIKYWNPFTNTVTQSNVVSFPGYTSINVQGHERRCSADGNRMIVQGNRTSDGRQAVFAFDIPSGRRTQDFGGDTMADAGFSQTAPDGALYEGVSVSYSGQYLVAGLSPTNPQNIPGGRVVDIWAFPTSGTGTQNATFIGQRRTLQFSHKAPFSDGVDDWLAGHAENSGTSPITWNGSDSMMLRLRDGLFRRKSSLGKYNYTGSGFDQRYYYDSAQGSGPGGPYYEIIAMRGTNGNQNDWRRLGPNHSYYVNGLRDQPDPQASRNGDIVIFDTNWTAPGSNPTTGISTRRFPIAIYDLISNNGWDGG